MLGLVVMAAGAGAVVWAISSRSEGDSEPPNGASRTTTPVAPTITTARTTAPTVGGTTFAGVAGRAIVEWEAGGASFVATIQTDGSEGVADVEFPDLTGALMVFRYNLTLGRDSDSWYYAGSNPRDASTGEPVIDYPIVFRLAGSPDVGWTFDRVCNVNGCYEAAHTTV